MLSYTIDFAFRCNKSECVKKKEQEVARHEHLCNTGKIKMFKLKIH